MHDKVRRAKANQRDSNLGFNLQAGGRGFESPHVHQTFSFAFSELLVLARSKVQSLGGACRNGECKADIRDIRSPLAGLRFHDLRHHAITELAESQTGEQTVMSIAGHVSPKMLAHYSHVRMEAKRKALDALSGGGSGGGYGTNHDTNALPVATPRPQVIEMNGRPVRARTADLHRVNFEVRRLKPFACLAFPFLTAPKSLQNGPVLVTNW